ncbi:MAG: hypothetical protein FJW35_06375 [Acidobacteria bacterium]|nr:hypothetical protein [Acidobacteriota bacterium]
MRIGRCGGHGSDSHLLCRPCRAPYRFIPVLPGLSPRAVLFRPCGAGRPHALHCLNRSDGGAHLSRRSCRRSGVHGGSPADPVGRHLCSCLPLSIILFGEIWALHLFGTGRGKRLDQTDAYDGQPAFSPDGRHLAYVSDRNGA